MKKTKRVLVEKDILNAPKYLKTFEHNGFVYGLEIHFEGRVITEGGRMVGVSDPYITLTKYEIKTYIHERYDFRKPIETFDLDIPQDYSWSDIPSFVKQKLQNDFIKAKWSEWLSLSESSQEKKFDFLNSLSQEDQQHLVKYEKEREERA
tara:strand:+ start:707 stop:1156 length:450 start_codon:yes stop_codon:yes gene_type:complete